LVKLRNPSTLCKKFIKVFQIIYQFENMKIIINIIKYINSVNKNFEYDKFKRKSKNSHDERRYQAGDKLK